VRYRPAIPLFPVLALLLAGCPSSRSTDSGQHDAQSAAVSAAPAASAPIVSASSPPVPVQSAAVVTDGGAEDGAYTRGDTWATCMNGFRPESTLERDLIRLGMLCGPYHGMRRLGAPLTGKLAAGKPASHRIETKKGQCFRTFVVAEEPVGGLKLRAIASGNQLSQASADGRWAVLDQQGSWCVEHDSEVTIELEATSGQGDYAMQVWVL